MRRKGISKLLERTARAIKDSDEFVEHVGNVAERYRREHELDAGLRSSAMRQSLKQFRKHAQALAHWLEGACVARRPGVESEALVALAGALDRAPSELRSRGKDVLEWLSEAEAAAGRCLSDPKRLPRKTQGNASRIAAEGLRATFEHHDLKVSTVGSKERPSSVVSLLCAIAKSAGDASLTPADARRVFVESGKRTA
jgi:hypothetical protein